MPLLGFSGAPFTLASYLVEGGPSRDFLLTKAFMHQEPEAWAAMMTRLADVTAAYLGGQIAAGVQAVQLFDSWVGTLSPSDYRHFVEPYSRRAIRALPAGVPVIHFGVGAGGLLEAMKAAGGDVIGLDWRVDLGAAWARLGPEAALTGAIARGDEGTVERHRAAIAERTPELLPVWTELAEVTRAVAGRRSWT